VNYKQQHYPNMLRVIRQNSGYTQRRIAKLLGHKNAATLCDWENEKIMPSGTNLIKLCIIYDKTPRELYPDYYNHIAQQLHDSHML
jgi:transcriptional regulator with XRE-family HTH domain